MRLGLDALDAEGPALDGRLGAHRDAFVAQAQAVELLALERDQLGGEVGAVMRHLSGDRPVLLGLERLDLAFAIDDQAQRDRLHAARRLGAGQLAPQHRGKREAEQVIERAAGEVGVDEVLVELARGLHRLGHRLLGDGIEGDALHVLRKRLTLGQQLPDMPGNRLTLTIGVGGEDQAVGLLGKVGDRLHLLALVAVQLPIHREVLVRADRAVLGRQVADVAVGGEDAVVLAQVLLDGLGLGRRFYDDELHIIPEAPLRVRARIHTRTRWVGFAPSVKGPCSRDRR